MSQSAVSDATITELQANLTYTYITVACIGLVAYEFVLTLSEEVRLVWRRKWTTSTLLFMANRYTMIINTALFVIPDTAHTCRGIFVFGEVIGLLPNVINTAFSTLRVFALSKQKIPVSGVVLGLSLVPISGNIYVFAQQSVVYSDNPVVGGNCGAALNISPSTMLNIAAIAIVVIVTWLETFGHAREAARLGLNTSLGGTLIRDGSLYFLVLLCMEIAQILIFIVPRLQTLDPVNNLIFAITPILVSRFLINLRQVGSPDPGTTQQHFSRFSVPGFHIPTVQSIVGNMGEQLAVGRHYDEDDVIYATEGRAVEENVVVSNSADVIERAS